MLGRLADNDPHAIVAIASLDDDRPGWNLVECIALSTWAGKPFVVPTPLRSPAARMRLGTLFLPGTGIDSLRAARILNQAMHNSRPELRATAAAPALIEALWDTAPAVQRASVRALGYIGSPAAVPALLNLRQRADGQLGGQIFSSLVRLGPVAVPALIENSTSSSAWTRWHCIHALGEMHDPRALPKLVRALADADHAVAWMSAKGLVPFGRRGVGPVLRLLMSAPMSPWLVETASYVLRHQRNPRLNSHLEPVLQHMHGVEFHIGTMLSAQKALSQLIADGLIEEGGYGAGQNELLCIESETRLLWQRSLGSRHY